jgi:hypothetical protein
METYVVMYKNGKTREIITKDYFSYLEHYYEEIKKDPLYVIECDKRIFDFYIYKNKRWKFQWEEKGT